MEDGVLRVSKREEGDEWDDAELDGPISTGDPVYDELERLKALGIKNPFKYVEDGIQAPPGEEPEGNLIRRLTNEAMRR